VVSRVLRLRALAWADDAHVVALDGELPADPVQSHRHAVNFGRIGFGHDAQSHDAAIKGLTQIIRSIDLSSHWLTFSTVCFINCEADPTYYYRSHGSG
jgi:hypothetical protein